jgi:threonine/homoserine/homoserine lactone efflux protein
MSLLLGLAFGYIVSIPPTGAVALLIVRRALQGAYGRGLQLAIGTVLADVPYVWLGTLGYGWVLDEHPAFAAVFDFAAAAVLIALAIKMFGWQVDDMPEPKGSARIDFLTGLFIGLANPTRLLTWSIVASIAFAIVGRIRGVAIGAYAVAVSGGALLWYVTLLAWWRRHGDATTVKTRRGLLVGSAVVGLLVAAWLAVRGTLTATGHLRAGDW